MTVVEMIDGGRFAGVINHLRENPEIKTAIQVMDDTDLAETGQAFVNGDEALIQKLLTEQKIKVFGDNIDGQVVVYYQPLKQTQGVNLLYLPPFYLFKDLNKEWK